MFTCKQKTSVSYVGDLVDKKFLEKYFSTGMYYCFFLRTSSGTNLKDKELCLVKHLPRGCTQGEVLSVICNKSHNDGTRLYKS